MEHVELCFVFHLIHPCEHKLYDSHVGKIKFSFQSYPQKIHSTSCCLMFWSRHQPWSTYHPQLTRTQPSNIFLKKLNSCVKSFPKIWNTLRIRDLVQVVQDRCFTTNCSRNTSAKDMKESYNLINLKQEQLSVRENNNFRIQHEKKIFSAQCSTKTPEKKSKSN